MARWLLQGVALDAPFSPGGETPKGAYGVEYCVYVSGAACTARRMLDALREETGSESIAEADELPLVRRLEEECELLSKIPHPNIVQFIGTHLPSAANPREKLIVTESMRMSVEDVINSYSAVPLAVKLHVLFDVSSGLLHLHSHGLVHGGLTAASVLLTPELRAKVLDLGVVRVADEYFPAERPTQRAPPASDYLPPEASNGELDRGKEADSFSFGHLALYLIVHEYPHPAAAMQGSSPDTTSGATASSEVQKRRKWLDKIRNTGNQYLRAMVEKCLQDEPSRRAGMGDIHRQMVTECDRHPKSLTMIARLLEAKHETIDIGSLEAELQQLFPTVLGSQRVTSSAVAANPDDYETSLGYAKQRVGAEIGKHLISALLVGLNDKKELLALARQAEEARRFEDMKEAMKIVMDIAVETGKLLDVEERTMLGVAFKNVLTPRRAAWRSLKQGSTGKGENEDIHSKYLQAVGQEILECSDEILERLDRYPIDTDSVDNQIFFHKMQGDHLRYQAEVVDSPSHSTILEKSERAFLKAMEIAKKSVKPSNLLRMAAAFNLSVFYFEVHHDAKKAVNIARETVDLASADIETSKAEDVSESTLLLQMIQERIKIWVTGSQQITYESPV